MEQRTETRRGRLWIRISSCLALAAVVTGCLLLLVTYPGPQPRQDQQQEQEDCDADDIIERDPDCGFGRKPTTKVTKQQPRVTGTPKIRTRP